jgi:predicted MFS family arabinose efflux permease
MLGRGLDDSFDAEIRNNITAVTAARLVTNACYRFAPPFLAIIAKGFDASIEDIGIALAISELTGLTSPMAGRLVDRLTHRMSMLLGLIGTTIGCVIAALSPNLLVFGIGVTVLALTKQSFDLGLGAWIADHVKYEQRGRIVGLTETAWALGLLVGVSAMGVITAVSSWRVAYWVGIVSLVAFIVVIAGRINAQPRATHVHVHGAPKRITGRAWLVVATMFCIMASAQNLFVTFGAWLEDDFGFGAARISAVGFLVGGIELVASTSSARLTDTWGKENSIALGALLIVPSGILLALGGSNLIVGVVAVIIYFMGFEFSVVSLLPVATQLVPNNPGAGLGWVLGAGTVGRAVMARVATTSYSEYGIAAPALIGAVFGVLGALCILAFRRRGGAHVD